MCTIKSNWHKPNPWGGGYFCSAYRRKKKVKLKLQIAFYPSQIHDSTDYYSQPSTIAMLPAFFFFPPLELLHLVESREKGAKEECTSWEVHFSANNKINYRQHSDGLQGSKEKKQQTHF